jgi:ribonuclease HI
VKVTLAREQLRATARPPTAVSGCAYPQSQRYFVELKKADPENQEQGTDMVDGSLTVGTDGACLGNPGPAGWAWVDEHGSFHSSGQADGTNNIAELRAVLDALVDHPDVAHLVIQIDSTYARDCSTTWRAGWQRNGMRNSKKQPVKNADIIEAIWAALDARAGTVRFVKVPGHDPGNLYPLNTAADILANDAAERASAGLPVDLVSSIDLTSVKPRPTSFGKW